MSRSRKFPMAVMTNQIDKDKAHRAVRKRVKQSLAVIDLEDPDIISIEGDTRSLGYEDWGTKFGFDTSEILSEKDKEWKQELSRK